MDKVHEVADALRAKPEFLHDLLVHLHGGNGYRVRVSYRFDGGGNVIAVAQDKSKRGLPQWEWSTTHPKRLERDAHVRACRVSEAKLRGGLVDITHLWADKPMCV